MKACLQTTLSDSRGLTHRECEVIQLMSKGLTRKETAKILYLSSHTVDDHVKNAMDKTGALNIANLIRISFEQGILV